MARQVFNWLANSNRNNTQTSVGQDIPNGVLEIGLIIDMTNMTSPASGLRVSIERSTDNSTWELAAGGEMPGGQVNKDGSPRTSGSLGVGYSVFEGRTFLRAVITTGVFDYTVGAVFTPGGAVRYGASIYVVT
jgi:hypothetical protein